MKEDEMGGACYLGDTGVDEWVMLEWILKEC
jgi:hypothetical protein